MYSAYPQLWKGHLFLFVKVEKLWNLFWAIHVKYSTPVISFLDCLYLLFTHFGILIPFSHLKVLFLLVVGILKTFDLMSTFVVEEENCLLIVYGK